MTRNTDAEREFEADPELVAVLARVNANLKARRERPVKGTIRADGQGPEVEHRPAPAVAPSTPSGIYTPDYNIIPRNYYGCGSVNCSRCFPDGYCAYECDPEDYKED